MTTPLVTSPVDLIKSYWEGTKNETDIKLSSHPAEAFKEYCRLEPWALECREYDV